MDISVTGTEQRFGILFRGKRKKGKVIKEVKEDNEYGGIQHKKRWFLGTKNLTSTLERIQVYNTE